MEIATICPECHAYLYLGLYNEHHRDELKKIVDAIHENGGKAAVQIWHGGFVPQEFFDKTNKLETPDNLTVERIHEIIRQYGQAAKFAWKPGREWGSACRRMCKIDLSHLPCSCYEILEGLTKESGLW